MKIENFWEIIKTAKEAVNDNRNELSSEIEKKLKNLDNEDLLQFQLIYEQYEIIVIKSTSHLIWNALYLINGGYCTNTYGFAGWLISNGQEVYYNAFKDSDSLVNSDSKKDNCNYEDLKYLASNIYRERTGTKIKAYQKLLIECYKSQPFNSIIENIEKEIEFGGVRRNANWKVDDLKEILPKLYKKHQLEKN
jgi:hypothetical protein